MALFEIKWLRRLIRHKTSPIPAENAALWKRRLSIGYALLAWQAFGLVLYMVYSGRNDWPKYYGLKTDEEIELTPAQEFSKKLNVTKGKIIRYSGFSRVGEEDFDNADRKN
ncbi:uncharacterized protein LOC119669631 [Teleopsis dalmanni]|uniref:uncharacterized protein LOC119669631 n=1 Tax=Teleopsis dalmanni TaxID=139649 RepID=UPI0018CE39D3|nr:uncharacterized protein LOC119669631 [Teleopsis dalmanni]